MLRLGLSKSGREDNLRHISNAFVTQNKSIYSCVHYIKSSTKFYMKMLEGKFPVLFKIEHITISRDQLKDFKSKHLWD